jgi:predicted transcriptional regulator
MADTDTEMHETLITLTSDIVAAHVGNNDVAVDQLPLLIGNVYSALAGLGAPAPEPEAPPQPAVPVRSSVKKDRIVCLEDGMELKMLKRHLMTHHNMSPAEYRQRWNLPSDYPMVAPMYAETRRDLAKKIGLGRKPGTKVTPKAPPAAPAPAKRRGRPRKSEAPSS